MSEVVWVSDVMLKSEVMVRFTMDDRGFDRQYSMLQHTGGTRLDPERLPQRAVHSDSRKITKMPNLFSVNGFICVSERAAAVLRQFDLGEGGLYPLELVQADGVTPIPGPFWALNFGARKEALDTEHSVGLRLILGKEPYKAPWEMADDLVAVSASAATGGPDLWTDPRLRAAFFLSDRLQAALKKEGIAKAFKLYRCKMIFGH